MNPQNTKKLFSKYKAFLKKKELKSGFECGDGWAVILTNLFAEIAATEKPAGFIVTKVFDKFGTLHVYTKNGNNSTRFAIEAACELASETCVHCGNIKDLQTCDKCKEVDDGSSTYVPDLKAAMESVNTSATPDETGLTTSLTATPSDYYFKMLNDPTQSPSDWFVIMPKAHWDANKTWYDTEMPAIETVLSNNGFGCLNEIEFEYSGLASAGHALLLSLGFVENLSL